MKNTLFRCFVLEQDIEKPFFTNYWARASQMGEAIQMIFSAAKRNNLQYPNLLSCDPYEIKNLDCEVSPDSKADVFWMTSNCYFPPEEGKTFILPTGIIPSSEEGEYSIDEISQGYQIETNKEGMISIHVNVEAGEIIPLYNQLINLNQNYKVFWYVLHNETNSEAEKKFLVNEDLNSPEKILKHLRENEKNSIQNGFVSLTAFLEEGSTNLTISDHKRFAILTYSKDMANQYRLTLENADYPQINKLKSIEFGMHHWHYRLPGSLPNEELEVFLKSSGFSDWNPKKNA